MIIEARDRSHYAVLEETAAGVQVTIWRRNRSSTSAVIIASREAQTILEAPFHIALDRVHEAIWNLTDAA